MAVLVSDSFNRADSTTTLGTTDSINGGTAKTWTAINGTWGISTSQAYIVGGTADAIAVVDVAQADVKVSITISATGSGEPALYFRTTDANNKFRLIWAAGTLYLQKFVANVKTNVASGAHSLVAGDVLRVECSGNSISVFVNNVSKFTTTDAFNNTVTKHGIGNGSAGFPATRWDSFQIDDFGTAPTGTPGSVSYATKQTIYQTSSVALATKQVINRLGATAYATKQTVYQIGSISYATQQTITDGGIPGAIGYRTKQIIYQVSSAQMATKQAIYRIGSSQWATQQSIMDFVEIISVVDITGEYDFVIDMVGEMDSVLDILGEMESNTAEINGVIGMAIENADIIIYARNSKDIRDTVKNKDGSPINLSGATIEFSLKRGPLDKSAIVVKKTGSGVVTTDPSNGVFVASLSDTDTDLIPRRYYYTAEVTDLTGKTTTVSTGHILIKP